tara:strand:- start:911 stop:1828 length:918 start_codon:yes stop_codon:yes gene_type:complete
MDEEKRRKLAQAEAAKRKIEEYQRGLLTEEGRQFMSDMSKNPMTAPPAEVYRDPVDASIRRDPTGIYGFLDRAMRPGRYGTADRMNRQFMEDLPQRRLDALTNQAKMQELQSEQTLRELESQALGTDEEVREEALTRLRGYMEAVGKARPVQTSSDDMSRVLLERFGAGSGGSKTVVTGPDGNPALVKRGASSESSDVFSPALTGIENMTPTELREKSPSMVASIDDKIAEQQSIIDTEKITETVRLPFAFGRRTRERGATIKEINAARVRLEQLQAEKRQLQNKIKQYSGPSSSEPSPTVMSKG